MTTAIAIQQLTKTYGDHAGIADLTLDIEQGEVMGFLGANGAGKTTTLRCLVGLLRPSSGSIRVKGLDPNTQHNELMSQVGYLPGELRLYSELTGAQHLMLLGKLQRVDFARGNELCERLGLSPKDLNRPIREYSRGMKQKIGLVQALQHDPAVLFLDEPTEGLDPLVQEEFFALLRELSGRGATVLLSSHVMSEVERACHRVAVLRQSQLVTVDTVETLKNARGRHIRCRFPAAFDRSALRLSDSWQTRWNDSTLSLDLPPNETADALRTLLQHPVEDVTVEEAGLDEALISLYAKDRQQ
jgi:ABC-2 type transport system ATP-binding protein